MATMTLVDGTVLDDRETFTVRHALQLYVEQMDRDIAAARAAEEAGGNGMVTQDGCRMLAEQFELQREDAYRVLQRMDDAEYGPADDDE